LTLEKRFDPARFKAYSLPKFPVGPGSEEIGPSGERATFTLDNSKELESFMASKHTTAVKSIALLLMLSLAQVYVLANPSHALFGRLVANSDSVIIVNGNEARTGTTVFSGASLRTPAGVAASVQLGSLGVLDISPGTTLNLSFDEGSVAVDVSTGQAFLVTAEGISGSVKTPVDELFLNDVGPAPDQETARERAAFKACMRSVEAAYRSAVNEARRNRKLAERKAQEEYRKAMRLAKTADERSAARRAKRIAQREAAEEFRSEVMEAQKAKDQAAQNCRRPPQPPSEARNLPTYPNPFLGSSFGKMFLVGLPIIAGSILGAIYIPCRRGKNPSPGNPGPNDECRREF
jgi:hypothetical protein